MKRVLSIMLALALALSLALPVLAAEGEEPDPELVIDAAAPEAETAQGMNADLEALTRKVKQTLGVDDGYTDFSSDYYDGPSPRWSLYWSGEGRQLTAEVRPDGTVTNMYRWEDTGKNERFYGFDAAFPTVSMDEAAAQAAQWCERLFTGAETGRVDGQRVYLGTSGYYRFEGTVLKNGLESPVTFNMVIDGTGLTSFYRSDQTDYVGELPEAVQGDGDAAAAALAGAVELELRWVSDGQGTARLMYMPVGPRTVVDPATGETVDMDALYESLEENGLNKVYDTASAEEAAMPMAADSGGAALTEVELSSIENYGDVLDQNGIDAALRALEELGLEGFEPARCSYAMDAASGDVTASVRYAGTMTADQLYGYSKDAFDEAVDAGQDMTIYKYITLDAKTGALKSLSTGYPIWEQEEGMVGLVNQAGFAEQFIEKAVPDLADQVAGCTLKGYDEREELVFARVQDGYFFPDDRIEIHVDPTSGVVDQFWYTWDEDIAFAPAEDIIGADEALDAYTGALDVTFGYVAWPIDITAEPEGPYADWLRWGSVYVEELRPAYYYGGADDVQGVDALTGEVKAARGQDDAYTYDDLDGVPEADMIETLGLAGVGLSGGTFQPDAELTMRDAAKLLLRAGGYYAPETDDEWLGEQASGEGFIAAGDWQPDETISRMAFLRMMLGASRYGAAMELAGVWDAGFSDVDADGEAAAAVARALGLAKGDTLAPDETLTRAGAAALLYGFMER